MSYPLRAALVGLTTLVACAPLSPAMAASTSTHAPQHCSRTSLHERTLADLNTSMRGEAFAHASYTFYAAQADREGLGSVARLYRRTAAVELDDHFTQEAKLARVVGDDVANLRAAIEGESYEASTMYPTFARQARKDGDLNAAELFAEIADDEAAHRDRFKKALEVIVTGKGTIPKPPSVDAVSVPAGPPQVHSARTKANLDTALHGEALANAKYTLFARHARHEHGSALARLFDGTAAVELREHFAGEAVLAGLVRSTRENVAKTIEGEQYEAKVMYPKFAKRAEAVCDLKAARLFRHNARDEAEHARAFEAVTTSK